MEDHEQIVVTEELEPAVVRELFARFLEYCRESGADPVRVEFGYAWNADVTGGSEQVIAVADLPSVVAAYAEAGAGGLGEDNLDVHLPGGRSSVRFCHESDIHLFDPGGHPASERLLELVTSMDITLY